MTQNDAESGPLVDLLSGDIVYESKNIEVGVDEDNRGYVEVMTPYGDSYQLSIDKGEVESFASELARSQPTLEPPESAPKDIGSPEGWEAGVKHTGGGYWLILFQKSFGDGRRIDVSADAENPRGVSIGGYRDGIWLGTIVEEALDDPTYDEVLDTSRRLIEDLENKRYQEEVREVFN